MEWTKTMDFETFLTILQGKLPQFMRVKAKIEQGADAVRRGIAWTEQKALIVWARICAAALAVWAVFRKPGLSEFAAIAAFVIAAAGSIVAIFKEKWRRLLPIFGVIAAIGTAIVILRAFFPRQDD